VSDGGLFVDEEAEGGPRPTVPGFNSLVTFPVPRRHSVTRVTVAKARYAAYGWVVEPRVERLGSTADLLLLLQGTQQKAVAVGFAKSTCGGGPEGAALAAFGGLAVEDIGHHSLGELCVFAITEDESAAALLGVPPGATAAVAVVAEPAAFARGRAGSRVCVDVEVLQQPEELLRFVNIARKVFSPCGELDHTDSLLMADLCYSLEMKVFLFLPATMREPPLLRRLDDWAAALQPRAGVLGMRLLLAEPRRCKPLMEDFGLTEADTPTAVAENAKVSFRFKDHGRGRGPGLDWEQLRQWLSRLAKSAGLLDLELS